MPAKVFSPPAVPLYTRRRVTSNTGKEYWGFEKVNLGAGRKPSGPFWLRHTDQHGEQKWVSAGDDYTARQFSAAGNTRRQIEPRNCVKK
jgi:hypothetical protein